MATHGLINGGGTPQVGMGQVDFDEEAWKREPRPGGIRAPARDGSFPQGNWVMNTPGNESFGAPQYSQGQPNGNGFAIGQSVDVGQLYQQWAGRNPHLDPQAAFKAGVDVGMGQVDDFSKMPYDPSAQPEVGTEVDEFQGQFPPAQPGGEFGEQFPPATGGELGKGFSAEGYVPGGLPGTGLDPQAGIPPIIQTPPIDVSNIGRRRG